MLRVFQEADKIILDLGGRRKDVLLSCSQSLALAETLETMADSCGLATPTLVRGERWGCKVQSYDGFVAVRFHNPDVGSPERVPIPPRAARQLASAIRFSESWARHKMRLTFGEN